MRNFKYCIAWILTFIVLHVVNGQVIAPELLKAFEKNESQECILVLKDQLDLYGKTNGMKKEDKARYVYTRLVAHAEVSQRSILQYLDSESIEFRAFHIFNGVSVELNKIQAQYILDNFEVERIIPNSSYKIPLNEKSKDYSSGRMDAEWGIVRIKADSVWMMGIEGEGVVVGGQDTGYDWDNPLVIDKYRGFNGGEIDHNYNWHDAIFELNPLHNDTINDPSVNPCGFLSSEPCDDHGHGTHTIGTMVGRDDENLIGVAPASQWIGCRNMDRGWGKPETYTDCFEWFLAPTDLNDENPDPTKAPHVINNSWGCPEIEGCNPDNWMFMETVVNNLTAAGTVVVVSAGNDGSNCGSLRNPAAIFNNSFTIGASNNNDRKAGFSSVGPVVADSTYRIKPDVVAPGVGVRSIFLNEQFRSWNGTSMAGPHVAGAVALIINANPNLAGQVDVIKDILTSTAVPLTDTILCETFSTDVIPNFYYGYGRIDVYEAVKMAMTISSTSEIEESPSYAYPNPSSGRIMIVVPKEDIEDIILYGIDGRRVKSDVDLFGNRAEVNISNRGVYIYTAKTANKKYTGKIIIE